MRLLRAAEQAGSSSCILSFLRRLDAPHPRCNFNGHWLSSIVDARQRAVYLGIVGIMSINHWQSLILLFGIIGEGHQHGYAPSTLPAPKQCTRADPNAD
jgi:hypothetical protein